MKRFQDIKYRVLDYIHKKRRLLACSSIPTPKILFIILLYSASFSLFLAGVRHIRTEQALAEFKNMQAARRAASSQTDSQAPPQEADALLQNHLAKNILRLHIAADSNSVRDQSVKLQVRDAVIGQLRGSLENAESPRQAEELIMPQLPFLAETARNTLARYGSDATVRLSIENRLFPVKTYGDLTFPAGVYRALCIDIGSAQGQNWWCVLFPSLCFVDETTAAVPEASKQKLRESLTPEEYRALEEYPAPEAKQQQNADGENASQAPGDGNGDAERPEARSSDTERSDACNSKGNAEQPDAHGNSNADAERPEARSAIADCLADLLGSR